MVKLAVRSFASFRIALETHAVLRLPLTGFRLESRFALLPLKAYRTLFTSGVHLSVSSAVYFNSHTCGAVPWCVKSVLPK